MKKHEILKKAYDNYPKGTVFTWAKDTVPVKIKSSGKFYFKFDELHDEFEIYDEIHGDIAIYNGSEWAEIVSDKKPLLISEDGVPLFEGDSYYRVGRSGSKGNGDWKLFTPDKLTSCHFVCCYKEIDKAFSTEQAALEWIEAQKPNEKNVKINDDVVATVYKEGWAKFSVPVFRLSENQIKIVLNTMEELNNA